VRSKVRRDLTRHYRGGNPLCSVASAVLLAAVRAALFVRRHELENAVGRVSNAQELGTLVCAVTAADRDGA
jgi:hypothetical protein